MATINTIRRVLLVRSGALGDFILSLRIIHALRALGAEHVTVLGRTSIARLALGCGVDRVLDIDGEGFHTLHGAEINIPESIRLQLAGHDLVINMMGHGEETIFSRRLAELTGGRVVNLGPQPRPGWQRHITEQWLADLRKAGIPVDDGPEEIHIETEHPQQVKQCYGTNPERQLIIIHPGSGSRSKCWLFERYMELRSSLSSPERTVAFLIGPVEEETMTVVEKDSILSNGPVLRDLPLYDVRDLLAGASLFIGNDSGVSHLASAVGVPVIALFGPTDPQIWRPLGKRVITLGGCGTWPVKNQVLDKARELL